MQQTFETLYKATIEVDAGSFQPLADAVSAACLADIVHVLFAVDDWQVQRSQQGVEVLHLWFHGELRFGENESSASLLQPASQ